MLILSIFRLIKAMDYSHIQLVSDQEAPMRRWCGIPTAQTKKKYGAAQADQVIANRAIIC